MVQKHLKHVLPPPVFFLAPFHYEHGGLQSLVRMHSTRIHMCTTTACHCPLSAYDSSPNLFSLIWVTVWRGTPWVLA